MRKNMSLARMSVYASFVVILLGLFIATATVLAAEPVDTAIDLEVENVGLLPTSRLYFLKELGRGVSLFFTFNPVKKADLQLDIANEKAAELQKIEEAAPENDDAIKRAVENYQEASGRLRARLETLKETSQNPNIDKLLDKLADRTVKHEKLFAELEAKIVKKETKDLVKDAKEKAEEAIAKGAEKDDAAKFAARLEKVLTDSKGGELKHLQSVDILDRISDKAPDKLKKELENLRQDFTDRLQKEFEEFSKKVDEKTLQDTVRNLPGDASRRAVTIEEIKRKTDKTTAAALEKIDKVRPAFQKEETLEQIKKAEEKIADLNKEVAEAKEVPDSVKKSLFGAETHLKNAKMAYESGKFGEAFGQARSAEVLARNGLRMLDDADDDLEDLREDLGNLEKKIHQYTLILSERKITRESNARAHALLENAKQHLGFARDALAKGDIAGVKLHIGHVKGFLSDLARIIEAVKPVDSTERRDTSTIKPVEPALLPTTVAPTPVSGDELMSVSVIVDESGNFNPREVKIRKGGKVTWVNKSQRQVWPASAPHPVHTGYPGFDALRGLNTGESYSFAFEKVGSWSYHNHLNPATTGAVRVVE